MGRDFGETMAGRYYYSIPNIIPTLPGRRSYRYPCHHCDICADMCLLDAYKKQYFTYGWCNIKAGRKTVANISCDTLNIIWRRGG